MPPSGFNEKAIRGLLQFVEGCYEDLLQQISDESNGRSVKRAIDKELKDIRSALESFSLDHVTNGGGRRRPSVGLRGQPQAARTSKPR